MIVTKEITAAMLAAILQGDPTHIEWFESYEESCMGWDGPAVMAQYERQGICRYFELDAQGLIPWSSFEYNEAGEPK